MRISSSEKYARPVHEGARPHIIRPKNRQALRWFSPGDGWVFAKKVSHPGQQSQPYLLETLQTILPPNRVERKLFRK